MPEALLVEIVDDPQRFLALEGAWDGLAALAGTTTFLSHAWLAAWVRAYGTGVPLRVLVAHGGGRLVAALPLAVSGGGIRRWRVMGAGALTPNHLDVVAEPAYRAAALDAFAASLLALRGSWDVLELDKLPADGDARRVLASAFEAAGLPVTQEVSAVCPYAELPATYGEYFGSLPKKTRVNAGNKLRRLYREQPDARFATVSSAEELEVALDALIRHHQRQWEARGYAGAFADARAERFHRDVAARALRLGTLRCYALSVGGKPIAVNYGFQAGDSAESYCQAMDASYASLSPGTVLLPYAIEQSVVHGARRYDMLEGAESYKAAWCPERRENVRLSVYDRGARGALALRVARTTASGVAAARRVLPPNVRASLLKAASRRRAGAGGGSTRA